MNTSRDDAVYEPPAWVEWDTASGSESSETSVQDESSRSSDSSDDDEYRPFMHLPANPDGRRCHCGSTTHMTVNSFACPLNPRNVAVDATTVCDGNATTHGDGRDDDVDDDASGSDDDDVTGSDDDDATGSDDENKNDDDSSENPPDVNVTSPVCRRRRLGLPTRRRRQLVPDNLGAPPSRRRRIANDTSKSEVQIDVGTNVKSPGTRWKLPATTIFKGKVVKKSIFRGVLRFEVKWQDGVIEYLKREHILPLLC